MLVLDTHVLVAGALDPKGLSRRAREAIAQGQAANELACSDISLWEIAMLIARRKIEVGPSPEGFISDVIESRSVLVLAITPKIAVLAQSDEFSHGDPADRIIAATALAHRARLVSADQRLRKVKDLSVIW